MDDANETGQIIRVTRIGLGVNVLLFVVKLAVGLTAGSVALIADAVHSVSDFVTDFVVLFGVRLSSRPADGSHDYGHGKYETIAALVVGAMLVLVGLFIGIQAGMSVYQGEESFPGYPVVAVALISIACKEWIFRLTRRVSERLRSMVLHVNAWHHRSDALSSLAVLIGAIAGVAGWGHGDHVAAIAIGGMIIWVGGQSLWGCFSELTEASISDDERQRIIEAIQGVSGVRGWHRLRTRLVGRNVFMDVHVQVDASLSVDEGHRVCTAVEKAVEGSVERAVNIVVHCEPSQNRRDAG